MGAGHSGRASAITYLHKKKSQEVRTGQLKANEVSPPSLIVFYESFEPKYCLAVLAKREGPLLS